MKLKTTVLIGASWLALAGSAFAQQAPASADERDRRIQELEQRLADIEVQLEDLKASASADVAEVRRVAGEQPAVTLANGRPSIASADGNFRFTVRGLVQYDLAHYEQDDPAAPDNRRADANLASDLSSRRQLPPRAVWFRRHGVSRLELRADL